MSPPGGVNRYNVENNLISTANENIYFYGGGGDVAFTSV